MGRRAGVVGAILAVAVGAWDAALGAPALAADAENSIAPAADYLTLIQEARFGVFWHDPNNTEQAPIDVSVETLSSNLPVPQFSNYYLNLFLHPRIALGAMINTAGKTSYAFASLNWRVPIYKMFYSEGEFGGAVDNSPDYHGPRRLDLGCPVTFRESAGFGLQLTPNWDVTLSAEHISHATLCTKKNEGVSDVGIRIGYKF